MKVSILHLSDIHFSSTKSNPILGLTEAIACAISGQTCGDNIIIAVSGDIAFSGRKEEYEIAASFFEDLQLKIYQRTNILPNLIIVPGNHDCDFK
jgi:3',5'-cyclic AMP phosphodiesterase CpdA